MSTPSLFERRAVNGVARRPSPPGTFFDGHVAERMAANNRIRAEYEQKQKREEEIKSLALQLAKQTPEHALHYHPDACVQLVQSAISAGRTSLETLTKMVKQPPHASAPLNYLANLSVWRSRQDSNLQPTA